VGVQFKCGLTHPGLESWRVFQLGCQMQRLSQILIPVHLTLLVCFRAVDVVSENSWKESALCGNADPRLPT